MFSLIYRTRTPVQPAPNIAFFYSKNGCTDNAAKNSGSWKLEAKN
jgi:hypothetical protein